MTSFGRLIEKSGGASPCTAFIKLQSHFMELADFKKLDNIEQSIFISKLLHAVKNSNEYFMFADSVVNNAELDGMFNEVKFGSEVYKEPAY
jgi:hypothetical protein